MTETSADDIDTVLAGVGPRLRQLRRARALTLAQLAERTGIALSTLSRLESGLRRPALEVLLRLSRVYRMSVDDLVGARPPAIPGSIRPRPPGTG